MFIALILSITLLFVSAPVEAKTTYPNSAEMYHIIHIKGQIYNKTTNTALKVGMKISSNDQIVFKSSDAKAVVLGTKRGRFILSASKAKASGGEFIAFVNSVVSPLKTNARLSTRGAETEEVMDLEKHFGIETEEEGVPNFAIIGDSYEFAVATKIYPLDRAQKQGLAAVIRRNDGVQRGIGFGYKGNVITIDRDLFEKKGINVEDVEKISIFKYTPSGIEKDNPQAIFRPVFIKKENLKAELEAYKDLLALGDVKTEDLYTHLYRYVRDVYGRADESDFRKFLKEQEILTEYLSTNAELLESLDKAEESEEEE